MKEKRHIGLACLLVAAFALTRWPEVMPYGLSAAYGIFLCSGAFHRRFPWCLMFGAMLLTDILKNVYYYHVEAVSSFMVSNYLAYAAIYGFGRWLGNRASLVKFIGSGVIGALLFYLITNTAAWLANAEYAKNLAGWVQSLTVGLTGWPESWKFFGRSIISGGLFSGLIAAVFKLAEADEPEPEEEEAEAPEAAPEESKS